MTHVCMYTSVFDERMSLCKFVCVCLSVNVCVYEYVSLCCMCENICDI